MKTTIVLSLIFLSLNSFGMTLTKDFVVTRLKYDEVKKIYDVDFINQAGIYKGGDDVFPCLQKSLKSNKAAKVTFDPMGLKITECVFK